MIVENEYHYIVRYWKSCTIMTDNQFVPPRELRQHRKEPLYSVDTTTTTTIVHYRVEQILWYTDNQIERGHDTLHQ